jgi:hypothetical protein
MPWLTSHRDKCPAPLVPDKHGNCMASTVVSADPIACSVRLIPCILIFRRPGHRRNEGWHGIGAATRWAAFCVGSDFVRGTNFRTNSGCRQFSENHLYSRASGFSRPWPAIRCHLRYIIRAENQNSADEFVGCP